MAQRRSPRSDSPTLPLPPPRSSRLSLDEFFEAATSAALRAAQAQGLADNPNPSPWARRPIWVGIIIDPWGLGGPPEAQAQERGRTARPARHRRPQTGGHLGAGSTEQ